MQLAAREAGAQKPPIPVRVIGASEPPARMASALPIRIMSSPTAMACPLVAQAVTVLKFSPLAPRSMPT